MKIAIIGAGMAGLTAARQLSQTHDVIVFDKSRGVGGRMSTRYAGDYEFDHGAQYFTVNDPDFQEVVNGLSVAGHADRWESRGFYLDDGKLSIDTGGRRWVGSPRMNEVAKALANHLRIDLGRRVADISGTVGRLKLTFADGTTEGQFDRVICTAPAPQAAALLPQTSLLQPVLSQVEMHACFALMVGLSASFDPGWDSLRVSDLPISWIARNSDKPGRNEDVLSLVIHAAAGWSDDHSDADRDWVQTVMLDTASALCDLDLHAAPHIALHRWLYAYSDTGVGQSVLIDPALGVILAGDWCVGGRVEGAFLSGRAAANYIQKSG